MNNSAITIIRKSANTTITKIVSKKQAIRIAFQNLIDANNTDKDILFSATSVNDADIHDLEDITNSIDMLINTKKSKSKHFQIVLDDTELASVKAID